MSGGIGFLLNGNLLVGVWKESLELRLGEEETAEALWQPHVREFDITGRRMQNWAPLGPEGSQNDEQFSAWIGQALKFLGALPAKEPRPDCHSASSSFARNYNDRATRSGTRR